MSERATEVQSSTENQQQRGAGWDVVDEAIATFNEWMLDDDYDAQSILTRIIDRMRERRRFYFSDEPRTPSLPPAGEG